MKEKVAKRKKKENRKSKRQTRMHDGAPSQIPTLKFLTHPAPQGPQQQNENSVQYDFYLLFERTHTKFLPVGFLLLRYSV